MKKFKPQKDKTIGDKYILKEFLGSGSYGYVWRSIKLENEEVVALKIPKKQESGDKVLKEGSKLQGHTHPNIIDINWMGRVDGVFVIEMEYFEGHTLADEIREYGTIKPRLFSNLYQVFLNILDAIEFMHSLNICHGDIKPDNILLGDEVKITDFGTSRLIEDLFVETIGEGTCGFIAPEVVNSQKRYLSSDIYSLGALLYFLLTGSKVHDSLIQVVNNATYKKPSEINSEIPLAVEEVILKSLERNYENRYETVEELRLDFETAIKTKADKITVKSYDIADGESWLEQVAKLYQAEKWQEAEKFLEQEAVGEVGPDLKLHLGYVQYKQGKFHTSLQQLKRIDLSQLEEIRQDNFAEELDYLKAKIYTALKEYDQALAIYKRLNDTYDQTKYKYRLAILEGLCSNLDRAIELLEEINQEYPQRLEIIKKLAFAYDQKKEFKKARGYFKYLQKLEPNNQKIKEKLDQYDKLL